MLNERVPDEFLSKYFCRVMCTCRYMFVDQVSVKVIFYAELTAVVLNVRQRYYCVLPQIKK